MHRDSDQHSPARQHWPATQTISRTSLSSLRVCTATRTSTPGGEHQIGLPPRQSRVASLSSQGAGALELALCANLVATVAARPPSGTMRQVCRRNIAAQAQPITRRGSTAYTRVFCGSANTLLAKKHCPYLRDQTILAGLRVCTATRTRFSRLASPDWAARFRTRRQPSHVIAAAMREVARCIVRLHAPTCPGMKLHLYSAQVLASPLSCVAAPPATHAYSVVAQTICWPKPKALPVSTRPNHPFAGLRVCTATRTSTPGGESHQIGLPPRQSRVPRFLHKTAAEPRNRCRHFERAGAGALELALCANLVATVAARRHQVPCARSARIIAAQAQAHPVQLRKPSLGHEARQNQGIAHIYAPPVQVVNTRLGGQRTGSRNRCRHFERAGAGALELVQQCVSCANLHRSTASTCPGKATDAEVPARQHRLHTRILW